MNSANGVAFHRDLSRQPTEAGSPGKSLHRRRDDVIVARVYYVYILRCSDGTLYTGSTTDVAGRESKHNEGRGAKYTACRRPVKVVYSETHASRSAPFPFHRSIASCSRSDYPVSHDAGRGSRAPSGPRLFVAGLANGGSKNPRRKVVAPGG